MKKTKAKKLATDIPDIGIRWSHKKIITTFFICLFVSSAGVFGFLFYQEYSKQAIAGPFSTPEKNSAQTKTYTNDYWGFRFTYPATWWQVIGSYQEGDYFFASEPINFISELEPGEAVLEVQTYDNYKNMAFADWLKDREQNYFPLGTLQRLQTTLQGHLYAEYLLKPSRPGSNPPFWDIRVISIDNKKIYILFLETDGPDTNKKFQETYNSITNQFDIYKGYGN